MFSIEGACWDEPLPWEPRDEDALELCWPLVCFSAPDEVAEDADCIVRPPPAAAALAAGAPFGVALSRDVMDEAREKEVGEGVARHKEPSGARVSRAFLLLTENFFRHLSRFFVARHRYI